MFARIMAVVMAAILITAVCLSGIWWITLRNQQIDARLDYLISEAEDIAYLAADQSGSSIMGYWDSTSRDHLNAKAEKVNREFGAYIAVVDRRGNVMRWRHVDIAYLNPRTLKDTTESIHGFTAVIFQHECDHLDGVLYIDKLD